MPAAVMVVEDEPLVSADLVESLETMGYEVTAVAVSAADCVRAAEHRQPDLVLMDIALQGDLDGIGAAQLLRERFDIPIVFLSGYADDRTVRRAKLAGALGYLLKPYRWSELKSAVEVALFRHQLECQMRERERWLSATLHAIGDAAIAVDSAGKVTFMNTAAEALIQVSEATARGQPLGSLVELLNENTREPVADPLLAALESGRVEKLPHNTALSAAGRELPVAYTVAAVSDGQGKVAGAVAVIKDLTEQRQAQQQVAVSDRLASLGVVAAGIAHEINNPLTYVVGNIEFLREELGGLRRELKTSPSAPDLEQVWQSLTSLDALAQDVQQGAKHVARIVADLNVFASRGTGRKTCNVMDRMEWALRVANSALARHARVTRVFGDVPLAGVDEGRLSQVFLNLLLNAADAMRETDRATNELTVTIELEEASDGPRCILVSVADTGTGMPADVLKRIFDPFFTTKPLGAGTGLGLAVCRGLVADMGGTIGATSTPGKGSRFVVRLPVALAEDQQKLPQLHGVRGRVLVIDDDVGVLAVLDRMLRANHDVVTARGADLALEFIRSEGPPFDVIICDLLMPDMNGAAFYRELARTSPELAARVVFLSGGAQAELGAELLSGIPNPLLQKPVATGELLLAIEAQLERSGRGTLSRGPGA
jgi:two-component system cell cycle sensor histidine kinase/response regulator CckA